MYVNQKNKNDINLPIIEVTKYIKPLKYLQQ